MLPKMRGVSASRQVTDVFGGYNHSLRIGDGEFYDMLNMTSDHYPVAAVRDSRGEHMSAANITGVVANNGLCFIKDSKLYGEVGSLSNGSSVVLTGGLKTMVSMGAYVLIFPDKKWVNVAKYAESGEETEGEHYGDIEVHNALSSVRLEMCKEDGTVVDTKDTPTTKPESPSDGDMWVDIGVTPAVLRKWDAEAGLWVVEDSLYLKITGTGVSNNLRVGDTVTVKGIDISDTFLALPEDAEIIALGDDHIMVKGYIVIRAPVVVSDDITINREIPDMDYLVECGNRLWGCKYGNTEHGFINEIYASELGDFRNFRTFKGVSTDSYTVSLGVDGPFTGAAKFRDRPVFFKSDYLIEIYGAYPAQYQTSTVACSGVQSGSERSLIEANGVLLYKGNDGVYAYDGSTPVCISQFGDVTYTDAVAGACGNKYYITMRQDAGYPYEVFVYDTRKGLWHKESGFGKSATDVPEPDDDGNVGISVYGMCTDQGILYINTEGEIWTTTGIHEDNIEWMLQTGDIGVDMVDAKYISRLNIRMSLSAGATVSVAVQYDGGAWRDVYGTTYQGSYAPGIGGAFDDHKTYDIPIRVKRCTHMRLRISGVGGVRIYSLAKTIEKGSEVY